MNIEIFREYDIRGIADRDLVDSEVVVLGKSIGTYLRRQGCHRITVGRDCRLSSDRLRNALAQGLLETGLDLTDIGVCPTPLLYFSLHQLEADGGVMITGSHNPADYNGFKVAAGKLTIYGEEIQEVRRIAEAGVFESGKGRLQEVDLLEDYRQHLARSLGSLKRPPRVVVDAGNGTAGPVAPMVFRDLGCEVIELYCTMDGNFPNHHPDPTVEANLEDLVKEVESSRADLGISFDGDGDRIGVVDNRGDVIWGDNLMIVYSREVLQKQPGATIVGEVKCSKNLYDEIQKHGGTGIMWKAGHSLIKAKMKETGALLAGEMSGHIFFADRYFGYDDAIYAGARLLEIISERGAGLRDLLADVPPTYSTPEIRVDCPESLKFGVVKQAQDYFSRHYSTVTVDGVRVLFEDGWGLVRASNTQPALVLRFEAESEARLQEIRGLVEDKLEEIQKEGVADRQA